MFSKLLFLVIQRGFGIILYSMAAAWALPSENIFDNLYLITIFDFVFGMALPTLRTSVVAGRINHDEVQLIALVITCIAFIIAMIMGGGKLSLLLTLIYLLIFPIVLKKTTHLEMSDINKALRLEAKSAMMGAILAAGLLIYFRFEELSGLFASPMLRGGAVIMFQLYLLRNVCIPKSQFNKSHINLNLLFNALFGLDYLGALSFFRAQYLINLESATGASSIVKAVVLIYDPFSSFVGYYIRSQFSAASFVPSQYLIKIFSFFVLIFLLCSGLAIATLLNIGENMFAAGINCILPSFILEIKILVDDNLKNLICSSLKLSNFFNEICFSVLMLLGLAGLTTHSIISGIACHFFLVTILIVSALLLFFLPIEYIVICVSFLMISLLYWNFTRINQ